MKTKFLIFPLFPLLLHFVCFFFCFLIDCSLFFLFPFFLFFLFLFFFPFCSLSSYWNTHRRKTFENRNPMGGGGSKARALFESLDSGLHTTSHTLSEALFHFVKSTHNHTKEHNGTLKLDDLLTVQRLPGVNHPVTHSPMLLFRVCFEPFFQPSFFLFLHSLMMHKNT